jgi:cell wall-associated NlpC family hydrolase
MPLTREQAVRNGLRWLGVQGWTPATDTVTFDELPDKPAFASCYAKTRTGEPGGTGASYTVIPYVYGGFLRSPEEFVNQIGQKAERAAGGWDRSKGTVTSDFSRSISDATKGASAGEKQPRTTQKEYLGPSHLLGTDCSGFVQNCWGVTRQKESTGTLAKMCLAIEKRDLKPGDILDSPGDHVVLFRRWTNPGSRSTVRILHAQGGKPPGSPRPYRDGDVAGRVAEENKPLGFFQRYGAYSPFPQFVYARPFPNEQLPAGGFPPIDVSVRLYGSGSTALVGLYVDQGAVPAATSVAMAAAGRVGLDVVWSPSTPLGKGRHAVQVVALNRIKGQSFQDEFVWAFEII